MAECVDCGSDVQNKDSGGRYRKRCCSCIIDTAGSDPNAARPIAGCSCDKCEAAKV